MGEPRRKFWQRLPRIRGKGGFTLIELMIANGILALVTLGMISLVTNFASNLSLAREQTGLRKIRSYILENLNKPDAWVITYQSNAGFGCLLSRTATAGCLTAGATAQSLILRGRNGAVVHSDAVATNGYTFEGRACSDFSLTGTTLQNLRCPVRLELTWTLVNWGGQNFPTGYFPYGYYPALYFPPGWGAGYFYFGRIAAQVEVRGRFYVNLKYRGKVNPSAYDFTIYKDVP